MGEGDVLYANHEGICTLKLVGDIRYTTGPAAVISRALDAFLDRLLASGEPHHVVVDMTETTSIDSTNLGLLARLATCVRDLDRDCAQPVILSTQDDITRTLESVGFDRVFDIVREPRNLEGSLACLPRRDGTTREMLELILASHKRLVAMNDENRRAFSAAVDLMEGELAATPPGPATPDGPAR